MPEKRTIAPCAGRWLLAAGLAMALAACSSADKPQLDANAGNAALSGGAGQGGPVAPGSERDFILNVGDRVHFLVDQWSLTPQAQETLRKQAAWLQRYPSVTVRIEGHADERGTREYNLALSARRAQAVKNFLVSQGVAASRISTIAYGKERPIALCDAERCWAQNRRAVTVITGGARS
jgi:peptidoglycan-associated lipoprotein